VNGGSSGNSGATSNPGSSPLSGTWDVISSVGGPTRTATLTLQPTLFELTWDELDVTADLSNVVPNITYTIHSDDSHQSGAVTATHLAQPLDLGQMPYGMLGGSWNFRGRESDQCTANVQPGAIEVDCSNLAPPLISTLQGFDFGKNMPLGTGTSTAQRTSTADSMFGELGGAWTVVTPLAKCDVTFQANRVHASCNQSWRLGQTRVGLLDLTVENGVASGTTNAGEFSARRR
jgi:hypothetical protein